MIKIIQSLQEPEKSAILKQLQEDGLASKKFGEYCRFNFEELQDVNSTLMGYVGNDNDGVDNFLNQFNQVETDFLKVINRTTAKSELKKIQLKVRNSNKRTRLHILAIQERLKADIQDKQTVMSKLKNIFK